MESELWEANAEIVEVENTDSDFKHPLLTYARFIFADDRPNGNLVGVEYSEFPNLIATATDMPIKMFVGGKSERGHSEAKPIGHIKTLEEKLLDEGTHQLIANAVLYADEFPKEIQYLKDAYDSGKAPGLSWEIKYATKNKRNGVQWLTGVVAKAATFVSNPAYGKRTTLLALASSDLDDQALANELNVLAAELIPKNSNEGGNNMDEKEKKELLDQIAQLKLDLEAAKTAAGDSTKALQTAQAELTTAQTELTSTKETILKYEHAQLIDDRTQQMVSAGYKLETDEAKLASKQEFWAALPEESFNVYKEDLAAAIKAAATPPLKLALASLSPRAPKLTPNPSSTDEDKVDLKELRARLRNASRGSLVATAE